MSENFAAKELGGVVGKRLIRELRGETAREMQDELVVKKMIATTRMFGQPAKTLQEIKEAVATYTSRAAEKGEKCTACLQHFPWLHALPTN